MRVPQQLDYTLRALVVLGLLPGDARPAAGTLASRAGLPVRFVEQQMTTLVKAGIVASKRGSKGGCSLARPAEAITLAEVVRAIEGDVLDVPHVSNCAVSEFWEAMAAALEAHLRGVTLADLIERQATVDSESSAIYYI